MADVSKEVRVAFQGDDRISKTIDSINSKVQGFAGGVESATQPLADLTEKLLLAEAAFAALAIGGLAYAVTQAGEFGDSFSEISTLIDVPKDSLDLFRQGIIDYARDSTASIEDINSAIYAAISAGVDYEDALAALTQAEQLSVAGKAELGDTITVLVSSLNAYGASTDEAQKFSDALFTTVKFGQTTLPELGQALANVTGIAAASGVGFDELNAAIAALTASGAPTSLAVTQVKSAIVAIVKPTSQAQEMADKLGIAFNAEALASKGLKGVLDDVYTATGGNVEQMGKLFGRVEGLNGAIVLGADTAGKFSAALRGMDESAGASSEAYAKMAENFRNINKNLINNIRATLIEVGTPLLDEWGGLAEGLSDIFKSLSIGFGEGSFDPLFDKIQEIGTDLAEWLGQIAEALPDALAIIDWDDFIKSIDNVIKSVIEIFESFFGALDLTKPEDLAQAIQLMINSLTGLNNVVSGILDSFKPFIEQLADIAKGLTETDEETQKAAGNMLGLATVINKASGFLGDLSGSLNLASGALGVMAGSQAINTLINLFGKFGGKVTSVITQLGKLGAIAGAFGVGWLIGDWLVKNIPIVDKFATSLADVVLGFQNLDDKTIQALESQAKETEAMGDMAVAAVRLAEDMDLIPAEKVTDVQLTGTESVFDDFDTALAYVQSIPETVSTDISAHADEKQIEAETNKIIQITEKGAVLEIVIGGTQKAVQEVKDVISQIPPERVLEIQLQHNAEVKMAEISAAAENVQTALRWSAEINIADIEAARDIMINAADNMTLAFTNTGDVISAMVGELGNVGALAQLELFELIEREFAIREMLAQKEIELSDAQIAYITARTEAMERGEALINIQMDGIYPELELVMWKIIERVQIRATEEGLEFLVGI